MAERRAARTVPGDAEPTCGRPMKVAGRGENVICRARWIEPRLREEVASIKQELRRGLAWHAVGSPAPVSGAPAHWMEIGSVQPFDIHK